MNFKSIATASLLAGFVFSAAAATVVAPTVTKLGTIDYSVDYDKNVTWTATTKAPKTYTNIFSFTLDEDVELVATAQITGASPSQYWLTGGEGTLSLYDGVYTVGSSLSSYTLEDTVSFGSDAVSLIDSLEAGSYFYVVTGTTAGSKGAKYEFTLTAIPEPANAALLLAGLGLFGVVAKRRKLN
jgi:hypothetical protein